MARTPVDLDVSGAWRPGPGGEEQFVLTRRLTGRDTYLSGMLALAGTPAMPVRVLTLDDVTVLVPDPVPEPTVTGAPAPAAPEPVREGVLRLRAAGRPAPVPVDLAEAAEAAGLDWASRDPIEVRHLLAFLAEARGEPVRRERIRVIVESLTRP
ncbi:hypothetical protein [Embleya sp. MST-111070]|uniref:hypothetical protein n=1 Tax=Embleya sp. MST-111070 TaxID=3398231 RepID=UPI003F739460